MNTNATQYAKIDDHEYNNCDDGDNDGDNVSDATITDNDHEHAAAASPYSILPTDEDREAIINDALDELADVARENILEFKREDFDTEEIVGTWIDSYLCEYFSEFAVPLRSDFSTATAAEADALNEVMEAYIRELYDEITERFYDEIAPPRVSPSIHTADYDAHAKEILTAKIRALQEKPQPDQRTPEWYARRNNLITASAASKAFGSQASVNQLVYEKCKSQTEAAAAAAEAARTGSAANQSPPAPLQGPVNSPLHWGQRYEPVTVMVYEHRNRTTLGEFGCIQHETYPFIGASPDGINIDAVSLIYGRMVEIKNIVNREITGHPKEEYWIQTQIQMEVCDLDECDFVETRFKEYESKEEYDADGTTKEGYTAKGNEKGVILWFQTAPALTQSGHIATPTQLYEYAPIGATPYQYDKWEVEMFTKHERLGSIWVRTIYWYLDEYSCVLVRRNRLWFEEAVKVLADVWAMIEEERETGYEHRAPVKRRTAGAGAGAGAATTACDAGTEMKIIKLESAIVPTTNNSNHELSQNGSEATATNMATLMAINNHNITNKKYGGTRGKNGGGGGGGHVAKGPSEVLISCFKLDDLEIDESKIE
jgi:putative phage-type endonuclease